MFKLDLEKVEEPEIKLPTSAGSQKKQESSRRTNTSVLLTMLKPLTVPITINWKILKEKPLEKPVADQEATVRTGHGTTDWFQIGKGVPQGWKKHKLESRLPEEIPITSDMQMTPPLRQKTKKN